jgi:hypothetical protein
VGLYTRIVDENNQVVQIKTGFDYCETFSVGQKLSTGELEGEIPDGIYDGLWDLDQEDGEDFFGALVIIHKREVLAVIPYGEGAIDLVSNIVWEYENYASRRSKLS